VVSVSARMDGRNTYNDIILLIIKKRKKEIFFINVFFVHPIFLYPLCYFVHPFVLMMMWSEQF